MGICVFCNTELNRENSSSEHIIHQALGGLLESENICCTSCNSTMGTSIDSDFTRIFAHITESFHIKTSRKKAKLNYYGTVKDRLGNEYKAKFKGIYLQSLFDKNTGEFIKNIKKSDVANYELISFDFEINEVCLKNGFQKIAFNYAVMKGISPEKLNLIFDYSKKEFIDENSTLIPFKPLNPFDSYLELNIPPTLMHTIILFNLKNQLYVFIDLFNTFQFYVHLSDNYEGTQISFHYCQILEKRFFEENKIKQSLKIRRFKDAHIISMQYGVELNKNDENLEQAIIRIEKESFEKIRKKGYVIDYYDWLYTKFNGYEYYEITSDLMFSKISPSTAWKYYFIPELENDEGDIVQYEEINKKTFRISTPISFDEQIAYPIALLNDTSQSVLSYRDLKIGRLINTLIEKRNEYQKNNYSG